MDPTFGGQPLAAPAAPSVPSEPTVQGHPLPPISSTSGPTFGGQEMAEGAVPGSASEFREVLGRVTQPVFRSAIDSMRLSGVPIDALKQAAQTFSPMYQFLDYPANWAMKQVGSRVSSLATTVAKNLLEGKVPGPVAVEEAIRTGKPQENAENPGSVLPLSQEIQGLDPETPTYSMLRQKGLPPDQALVGALLLEGVAAGPINEVGGAGLKGAGIIGSAVRGTALAQKMAEVSAPIGRLFSRTYELSPVEKNVIDEAVFQGRGIQNMTENQFQELGQQFMDAAKRGSKARGEPVEAALTRMGTAQENLPRMPQEKALEGLTREERNAVLASRDALAKIPGMRSALDMAPDELNAELPRLIQTATQRIVEAKKARALAEEATRMSVPNPFGGDAYRTPGAGPVAAEGEWNPYEAGRFMRAPIESPSPKVPPERVRINFTRAQETLPPGSVPNIGEIIPEKTGGPLPYEQPTARLAEPQRRDFTRLAQEKEAAARQALSALEETGRVGFARGVISRKMDLLAAERLLSSVGASDVGYIPRIADEATAQTRALKEGYIPGEPRFQARVNDLRTGPMLQRTLPSDVTTEEAAQMGQGFLPQSEALPIYGARKAGQMRNASILSSVMRHLSKDAAEAPPGWLDPNQLGLMGGMSDAFKAQYQNARISPTVFRYLRDWEKVSLPSSETAIAATRAKILSFWKPLVTTIRPEFLERFAGWHFAKSVIDGNVDPENYIDGILAASGKQLNMPVQDVPGISTVGELRDAAIKAGAIGSHGKQDFNTLILSRANSAIYDATKTSYLVDRLRKGDTLQEAAKATREALFDYSPANFTQFENFMRRHVMPFYAFRRQIVPAFARTVTGRAGSLGFAHQVVADINASKGYTNEQAAALLPGGEESGVVVDDPNAPTARKLMGSPFRDINQSLGQRGRGVTGYWDGIVSMLAPDISTFVQQGTGRGGFGQDLGKNVKLPSVARLMPQWVRDKLGVYEENGELKGPGRLAQILYSAPPPVGAAVDLARGDTNVQKFLGAAPADTANVAGSLVGIASRQRAALQALREARQR